MTTSAQKAPASYIGRRVHSIFGLLIVFFFIEHIITNSQSALLIGENGEGYVRAVNFIKNLPFLPFLEIFTIGVPILVHMILGIKYMVKGSSSSLSKSGKKPSLGKIPKKPSLHFSKSHCLDFTCWDHSACWIYEVL